MVVTEGLDTLAGPRYGGIAGAEPAARVRDDRGLLSRSRAVRQTMTYMARRTAHAYDPPTVSVKGRNVRLRTIGFVLLAGLAIWFIAANTASVTIRLWVPTVTLPLWSVLTVTLLVGTALGLLVARRRARR